MWAVPWRVLAVILVVELVAVATLAAGVIAGLDPLPFGWEWTLAVLMGAGIVTTEASLGVERMRLKSEGPHIDLSSVWAFAAAVLLPGPMAAGVIAVIYAHIYARVWRRSGVPLYRVVYSTAAVMLAVQAAAAVIGAFGASDPFRSAPGLLAVVLALLTYAVVNMALVVSVIVLSAPVRSFSVFLQVLGRIDDAVLEFATLSMGALVAGAMASFGPAYAVLVLPPLVVLHRSVLVRQLEQQASTDSKTGLLNASAWHVQAGRALRRAERTHAAATVLVLDLDHFKLVNDRYGHLVGDQVLAAIAATLRAEVRDEDIVGRFGGEEFVILLRGLDGDDIPLGAHAVAERIRGRVAALRVEASGHHGSVLVDGLTVSIGGAALPGDGTELAELLEAADTAMYAAKNAGRNKVRMGWQSDAPRFDSQGVPPRR